MYITFYGAVREVTGSMHMITTENDRILLDCGLFQGRRKESEHKNRALPFDPGIITNVVLSHAHIDHSGRIPMLTGNKFNGRIVCTRPTVDACNYLLADSAHIQESDAHYLNYKSVRSFMYGLKQSPRTKTISKREVKIIKKMLKKSAHELNIDTIGELLEKYKLEKVTPLYTISEAEKALQYFDGYPFRYPVTVGKDITCTFYVAGHILGSAITIIRINENGRKYNICYSGDVGRFNKPILYDPTLSFEEEDRDIDLMIMESTYGDREHEPVEDLPEKLKHVLIETYNRNGSVVIPAFAFGRTQELIYFLHELYNSGDVPKMPVYVDSPLAVRLTKVFGEHPESYDKETHKAFLKQGENPFIFKNIQFIQRVEDSMALMRDDTPHVVISASGMCEAGRILHHLRYKIHDSRNTILLVGFMAQHTLGRRLEELGEGYQNSENRHPPPELKILNKLYPLKARVVKIGGFSAHGDKNELARIIKESNLRIKRIALVHGEESQSLPFADYLTQLGYSVSVPHKGESVVLR